ncbi:hypothetical protein HDU84_005517 [Entophlyctis sp. JEL0112]|nr:hypothetical protein HDU84_005517 [Entophlyctis sp. JEL0112]
MSRKPLRLRLPALFAILLLSVLVVLLRVGPVHSGAVAESNWLQNVTNYDNLEPADDNIVHPDLFASTMFSEDFSHQETTSVLFNVFSGPVENLSAQIKKACSQKNSLVSHVIVHAFASKLDYSNTPYPRECAEKGIPVEKTISTFNYKFHGRFLLTPMLTSKYVMIVDDDVALRETTVAEFISAMKASEEPAMLGIAGQTRAARVDLQPGWHTSDTIRKNSERVDYLCNLWFLKSIWLTTAFMRESPSTWYTGEDIHLSYVLQKYLNIPTKVVKIHQAETLSEEVAMVLKDKPHAANKEQRVADVRNDIFRVNFGKGFEPALGGASVQQLVFVQNLNCAKAVISNRVHFTRAQSSCFLITGRGNNATDIGLLKSAAKLYSEMGNCKIRLQPKWGTEPRLVRYFDLKLGLGLNNSEYPLSLAISDMIPALVGILSGGITSVSPTEIVMVFEKSSNTSHVWRKAVELVNGILQVRNGPEIRLLVVEI